MPTQRPNIDEYWAQLASVLPEFPHEQQETAVALYRALAQGQPLSTEAVAQALNGPSYVAAERLTRDPLRAFVYAEQGQIVGFGGLAAAPMHHEFRVARPDVVDLVRLGQPVHSRGAGPDGRGLVSRPADARDGASQGLARGNRARDPV